MLLCAAALLMKLLVPAGYMIGGDQHRLAIILCSGVASEAKPVQMAGMHGDMPGGMPDHGNPKDHGKAEMPCAFSGLSAAVLGVIDPILLAALVAFIIVLGLRPALLPAIARQPFLRPPLRGPPISL